MSEVTPLFRSESLAQRGRRLEDELLLPARPGLWLTLSIFALVTGGLLLIAARVELPRVEAARGRISASGPVGAEVRVPARAIAFVKPGDRVGLRFDAFPYQTYGSFPGVVEKIGAAPVGSSDGGEASYAVLIRPLEPSVRTMRGRLPLREGMTLDAVMVLERASILSMYIGRFGA